MKKLLYIIIGVSLLAVSCTVEPDNAMLQSEGPYTYSDGGLDGKHIPMGTYNMVWTIDKEIVDTATFTNEAEYVGTPLYSISHFPMVHFLNLAGKNVKPEDVSYQTGLSDWMTDKTIIGYSAENMYIMNRIWAPQVWFTVNGEDYSFLVYLNDESNTANWQTSMMYDMIHDIWSGAAPVYKFQLTNHTTDEWWEKTFTPPINMAFQTTGRKK